MDVYLGMIAMFGFNFAPRGFALCAGQILSIQQNTALFSLIGTYYGGNGTSTFALPDLRSRIPIGMGQGPGLSQYNVGQVGGSQQVTLLTGNLPPHNHLLTASSDGPTTNTAQGNSLASNARGGTMPNIYAAGATNPVNMGSFTSLTGSSQPVGIMPPYLAINFCIATQGIFPSRN